MTAARHIPQLQAVMAEVSDLAHAFASAGHQLVLVGGIVRDLVLGRALEATADLDFATSAHPDEVQELVMPLASAVWDQGARFGTIACLIGGRSIEITTFRSEVYLADSRKPEVVFADHVEADLSRRDFTVNAMAVDMAIGALVDPFDGQSDLDRHLLRTPLGPEVSFSEDPLRMLRAARFVAGYDLVPVDGVVAAMSAHASRLAIVSIERIRDEVDKLLQLPSAAVGLRLLAETSLLERFLPEVGAEHIARVDRLAPDPVVRLAFLLGDDTAAARSRLGAMRYSRDRIDATLQLLDAVHEVMSGSIATDEGLRRGTARFGATLAAAVQHGLAAGVVTAAEAEAFDCRRRELAADLADLTLPLDGAAVMKLLRIPTGPEVGRVLEVLAQWRFEEGPLSAEAARERLLAWHAGG